MPQRDLIVVGASAGGVEALRTLVGSLPAGLPATVLVVLHVPAQGASALAAVLARETALDVAPAVDGEVLAPGTVRVAPPDRHLLVVDDEGVLRTHLSRGPRENGHRPAADPLFRSAAHVAGARVVGVVLSGSLDDGAAGLRRVRGRGGLAVVQDPADAAYSGMPEAALHIAGADHVAPVGELGDLLGSLVGLDVPAVPGAGDGGPRPLEDALAEMEGAALASADRPGAPTGISCPDCGGPLYGSAVGPMHRFRCRVGHAWSADTLVGAQTSAVESALWAALRSLEEKADLADRMSESAVSRGHLLTADRFTEHAGDARQAALVLRDLLEGAALSVPRADGDEGPSTGD